MTWRSHTMRLADFLDKGASLSPSDAPCLTMAGQTRGYAAVQRFSWLAGRALARSGVLPGDTVAVLSGNDPMAFGCVLGISRAGAIWCPLSPRGQEAENRELLERLDCRALIFDPAFAPQVTRIAPELPGLAILVCLDSGDADGGVPGAIGFGQWVSGLRDDPWQGGPAGDVAMIAGRGDDGCGAAGAQLTGRDIEAMTARTLMRYPFRGTPVYLGIAPLSPTAGVLCLPVMALGGEVVIMPSDPNGPAGLTDFLALIGTLRVTHAFLQTAAICQLLDHPGLPAADLSSLQCLWYGTEPLPAARLAQAVAVIGPVLHRLSPQETVAGPARWHQRRRLTAGR
jgi:acyl-CoA synthetase (AMP-forming)/AMP-acid ligase II